MSHDPACEFEAELGGPVATQRPLTQGNKLREPKDQLHEAIGGLLNNKIGSYIRSSSI